MIRIGVDPGCSGAVVVYDDYYDKPLRWGAMPTVTVGKNSRVNASALVDLLDGYCCGAHAFVELVGAMPGQGVTSMFTFGHAAGVVMGVLAAMRVPHTMVSPATWKKRAGLIGQDKDAARSRAIQLWPGWSDLNTKGRGQALADAILIARYGTEREPLPELIRRKVKLESPTRRRVKL